MLIINYAMNKRGIPIINQCIDVYGEKIKRTVPFSDDHN